MDKLTIEISRAVGEILVQADADIAARKPVCNASGRCCRFEEYGHRLYVTGVEMIHFNRHHGKKETSAGGCPYQVDELCTVRDARPLGCRVYFCDPNAQAWQNELYEMYHAQLRAVHEKFNVPYQYMEWRAALRKGEASCE